MSTQRPTGQRESSQQHKNGQREREKREKGRKLREKVSFETNYLQVYN